MNISRRDFLKGIAAGAVSAGALGTLSSITAPLAFAAAIDALALAGDVLFTSVWPIIHRDSSVSWGDAKIDMLITRLLYFHFPGKSMNRPDFPEKKRESETAVDFPSGLDYNFHGYSVANHIFRCPQMSSSMNQMEVSHAGR